MHIRARVTVPSGDALSLVSFKLMVLVNQTRRSCGLVAEHMACRYKIVVSLSRGKKSFLRMSKRLECFVSPSFRSPYIYDTWQRERYTCLAYSRAIHASVSMKFGNARKLADDSPAERQQRNREAWEEMVLRWTAGTCGGKKGIRGKEGRRDSRRHLFLLPAPFVKSTIHHPGHYRQTFDLKVCAARLTRLPLL